MINHFLISQEKANKKLKCEITTKPKSNNLDHLIDPTFRNINRLFTLSFKYGSESPTRDSFDNITCH